MKNQASLMKLYMAVVEVVVVISHPSKEVG